MKEIADDQGKQVQQLAALEHLGPFSTVRTCCNAYNLWKHGLKFTILNPGRS